MLTPYKLVRVEWDPEASVWVATSDDVPGLATESETLEALVEKLKVMIPELLEANHNYDDSLVDIPFELFVRRFDMASRTSALPG
jgi:predicted RNase H-like HicB family nuclease